MAADEDFDLDIYGDAQDGQQDSKPQDRSPQPYDGDENEGHDPDSREQYADGEQYNGEQQYDSRPQSAGKSRSRTPQEYPQGVKRKEGSDERPVDPGATSALLVSELNWWDTDDDIRGWANQAHCEDELKDITFSEYKANGKSKG